MARRRKEKNRELKPYFRILFEDSKSSRDYILSYLKSLQQEYKNIDVLDVDCTDPISLVNEAIKILQIPGNKNDVIWIVYDAESPQQTNPQDHHTAYNKAGLKIKLAISTVSYEVFILFHYNYEAKRFNNSDQVISYIKNNYNADYDKGNDDLFSEFTADELEAARTHALRLEKQNDLEIDAGKKPFEINPYTDFHKLLDAIDHFLENN